MLRSGPAIFWGAFVQVLLVAMNTKVIAAGSEGAAFVTGALVSWIWWGNVQHAREDGWAPRAFYTFGAACGTVAGMTIGGWMTR